jgi:hypothetical protein
MIFAEGSFLRLSLTRTARGACGSNAKESVESASSADDLQDSALRLSTFIHLTIVSSRFNNAFATIVQAAWSAMVSCGAFSPATTAAARVRPA